MIHPKVLWGVRNLSMPPIAGRHGVRAIRDALVPCCGMCARESSTVYPVTDALRLCLREVLQPDDAVVELFCGGVTQTAEGAAEEVSQGDVIRVRIPYCAFP